MAHHHHENDRLFQNATTRTAKTANRLITFPTNNDEWIKWFSTLPNCINLVTFVTRNRMFSSQWAARILLRWVSRAPITLQRVEFWTDVCHVQFTDNFHLGRVWKGKMKAGGNDGMEKTRFACGRGDGGKWELVQGGYEASNPDVEINTCSCRR